MRFAQILIPLAGSLTLLGAPMQAQTAAPPEDGAVFWIRFPGTSLQEMTSSTAAAPRFGIGLRKGRVQLGVGIGHVTLRTTDRDTFEFTAGNGNVVRGSTDDKLTATLYQIGPTVQVDLWQSSDRRTRFNIGGGVGVGRFSSVDDQQFIDFQTGAIQSREDKVTGTLIGFHASLGGDHFLHPNFALGAEAGYQGSALLDVEEEEQPPTGDQISIGAAGTYVALRVTVVF